MMQSENPPPESPPESVATEPPQLPNGQSAFPHLPSISSSSVFSQPVFAGRLHPLTMVFGLWKGSRAIIPIIPLILFGNHWFGWIALALTFAGTLATVAARYFSFRYRIEGNELITEEGIIGRKQRSIPLERVQEIRVEQGVLHRLLDVVDAQIETGGGEGAEASLSVLSRADVDRLRQAVFGRAAAIRSGHQPAAGRTTAEHLTDAPEATLLQRLSVKHLVFAGLTSNHLLSALVLAGAIWNFADDILPARIYNVAGEFLVRTSRQLLSQGVVAGLMLTLLFIAAVWAIGAIISVIGSVILFYGFTFSLRGEDLQRRYGLLTRRSSSLPRRRIQVLKIEESAVRRWFSLAAMRADTSGSHRQGEDDNKGRDVLLPIVPRAEVEPLLAAIFPDFAPDFAGEQSEWRRVSPLAVRRGLFKGGLICAAIAAVFFVFGRYWLALTALAGLPLVYLVSLARYRTLGYSIGEKYFRTRRGWLGRAIHIVPVNKIQAVEIQQTPFDRRLGVATLTIDTAGQAYTEGGPQISHLPIAEAKEIARRLAHAAAQTEYKW